MNWSVTAAIIGAINGTIALDLSLYNFYFQRRVRLRVIPKLTATRRDCFLSSSVDLMNDRLASIEVINLNSFAITIAEVGFTVAGQDVRRSIRPDPKDILPRRLEARVSMAVQAF